MSDSGFMMLRWRKIITVVAIAAIAFASCYAPRFAHATHHISPATQHSEADGHSHDHHHNAELGAIAICHTHGDAQDQDNNAGTLKYCCAAACSASALLWGPVELPDGPVGRQAATVFIEFLRSAAWSAIDPPPRIV